MDGEKYRKINKQGKYQAQYLEGKYMKGTDHIISLNSLNTLV
jgi:hypothetical protein